MLYVDIPTAADIRSLSSTRNDLCVSIYLPTTPLTQQASADRIELKNLAKQAIAQIEASGADKRRIAAVSHHLDDLVDDDEFWKHQAQSLAILATPDNVQTFRSPSNVQPMVLVSDRFHLKPLLRTVTFQNSAYVLALAENRVRLIGVSADLPAVEVKVDGLPKDAGSATGRATVNDRSPSGRIHGSEGQKVLLGQFARRVDEALRPLLSGSDIPLILAATQPLAPIYRSVNSYARLAPETIDGSPEALSDAQLAGKARGVLDAIYRRQIKDWNETYRARENQGRATTDIAQAARAATFGAVESLLADMDEVVHGTIDRESGAVTFADRPNANSYGIVDEIAARVLASGGEVLSVRKDDIPDGKALAAVLRYPV
ncbi:MAG: hypothetical protein WEC00_05595 [Dongiaceae bacterium]